MIRIEHDAATTRFEFEDAGDDARQQEGTETLVDDRQLGDGRVQPDIVRRRPDTGWRWNPLPLCTLRRSRRPGRACCRRTAGSSCHRAARAGICASAPPARPIPTPRTRCGKFIHSAIMSASASGSTRRSAYGSVRIGVGGGGTLRTSSESPSVSSRGRIGTASVMSSGEPTGVSRAEGPSVIAPRSG